MKGVEVDDDVDAPSAMAGAPRARREDPAPRIAKLGTTAAVECFGWRVSSTRGATTPRETGHAAHIYPQNLLPCNTVHGVFFAACVGRAGL